MKANYAKKNEYSKLFFTFLLVHATFL